MNISFLEMSARHKKEIIDIFNYYIENATSAYREIKFRYSDIKLFLEVCKTHPGYVIQDEGMKTIGFCMLKPYVAISTFSEAATITYFIHPEYTGKGIGALALQRLESDARRMGIRIILANISSENDNSLSFHRKHGFRECGRFEDIGKKFGRHFSIVWMSKEIA